MRIAETERNKRSASHLEQEVCVFARCRAGRPRREVPAGMKPSHRTARGEGVIVNAQMCR
jgi:hypothetical protein